jgi:hypothetical protein
MSRPSTSASGVAAPEAISISRNTGSNECGPHSLSDLGLPGSIVQRLRAESIIALSDWRSRGRKRLQIFGVTRRMVAELDALVRKVRT